MKIKKKLNIMGMLLLIIVTVMSGSLQTESDAFAESTYYEPLECKLSYKHIYTTNDSKAESDFHYLISAKDDAPLPGNVSANGEFCVTGISGKETTENDTSVYTVDDHLTFSFEKPGFFSYDIRSDKDKEKSKKNYSSYTFYPDTITVTFYVINSDDGNSLKLQMMTASLSEDVKVGDIVLEAEYKDKDDTTTTSSGKPDSSDSDSDSTSSKSSSSSNSSSSSSSSTTSRTSSWPTTSSTSSRLTSKPTSETTTESTITIFGHTLKTGDSRNARLYSGVLFCSAVIIALCFLLIRNDKSEEY